MPLPVYDAEHQLQMVREPGSPTLMHLRSDASAAQHAADASGLVLHALVVLPRSETRLAIGQGRSTLAACEPRHAFSADARGAGSKPEKTTSGCFRAARDQATQAKRSGNGGDAVQGRREAARGH
jgi:hypothetical protein